MAKIDAFFNLMFEQKASDLHMATGNPPMLRINGELQRVDYPALENDSLKAMLYEIAPDYKIKQFEETGDVDFGYEIPNISRFRVNFYNERKGIGAARVARRYDRSGNQIEEVYYNSCGKPTRRRDLGVARIHWRYDENGRKVEAEFFGPDGVLLSREGAESAGAKG